MRGYLGAACLLLILGAGFALAQEGRTRVFNWEGDNLEFERQGDVSVTKLTQFWCQSDSLEVTADLAERRINEAEGSDEFFLWGRVVAEEGPTRITGDRGHYDRNTDRATVSGSVLIVDADTRIHCDEAEYDRLNQLIHLRGLVEVLQADNRLTAQRAVYHRENGFAEAFGDVVVEDLGAGSVMRGEHGSYDRELDIAVMDAEPRFFQVEEPGDTIRVRADLMRQLRRDGLAVAVGEVRYLRGITEALCDSAVFQEDQERLTLYGEPRMLRKGGVLSGDTLDLRFAEGEVKTMDVSGAARFQDRPADARVFPDQQSEITGDRFHISFRHGDIHEVAVQGDPRSVYIPPVEESGRASVNEAFGDSMLLRFEADELDEVRIFGAAQGSYRTWTIGSSGSRRRTARIPTPACRTSTSWRPPSTTGRGTSSTTRRRSAPIWRATRKWKASTSRYRPAPSASTPATTISMPAANRCSSIKATSSTAS